ncbi:small subunit ribosomal protein S17 [Nitrosomonas marina]|uniref:Small ribosomal subunit protein uS17 n=1 Tax=Nitrosomonas marina TaxID=917 RepID=A0A1I0EYB5_9PROT|nr:30S ribosomal protein S17 [Nitrosomonas marina]SET49723.1 small subunit ribosomal protein S17 [Nitrosomonas marina]
MTEKLNRTLSGKITSNQSDKTVTVSVERRIKHPLYGKIISRTKKYRAHDEINESQIGDIVLIEECRPISKTKSWRVIKILTRGAVV